MVRALALENCREAETKKRCMNANIGQDAEKEKSSESHHKIDNMNNDDAELKL